MILLFVGVDSAEVLLEGFAFDEELVSSLAHFLVDQWVFEELDEGLKRLKYIDTVGFQSLARARVMRQPFDLLYEYHFQLITQLPDF